MKRVIILASLLTACGETVETGGASDTCVTMCDELVEVCNYSAFPDMDSCLQGCTWSQDQGGDVEGELACVLDASCDTFQVLECEHQYGLE